MSLLLPQTRTGTVRSVRRLDIHGDRYVDVSVVTEPDAVEISGRLGAMEAPGDLAAGDRVTLGITMGVITRLSRA